MMNDKAYGIYNKIMSLFFPDRCAICGKITDAGKCVCDECRENFSRKQEHFKIGSTSCYSVCEYNDSHCGIVIGAKKQRDFSKLSFMASEIYDLLKAYDVIDSIDVIIPVPMSRIRRITRGYNHTEKISRHLSYLSGIKTVKALRKVKETREQKTLTRRQRLENLKDCYKVIEGKVPQNQTVLVIDDVTTTGSTLNEISRLLKTKGNKVVCAVFARTPFYENKQ